MTRKEVKYILQRMGIANRFSLTTQTFLGRDTRQILTVKDWEPDPKANEIKQAFHPHKIIVQFDGPNCMFS